MPQFNLMVVKAERDYLAAQLATSRPDENLIKAVKLIDSLLEEHDRFLKENRHLKQQATIVHAEAMGATS